MAYSDPTLKRLFALSGNVCAFPNCPNPIIDPEHRIPVGEICHIEGRKKGSARFNENQTDEERDAFENLVLMCLRHHTVIDHKDTRDQFTVEMLRQYKVDHEAKHKNAPVNPHFMQNFIAYVIQVEGSIITTINQSGGQAAHTITNIYPEPPKSTTPPLVPLVESFMCSAQHPTIDIYDLKVRLQNDGKKAVRDFMVEIDVPHGYANPNASSSIAYDPNNSKEGVTTYTIASKRDFVLYPGKTSDHILMVDYQLRHEQYATVNESIVVSVYSDGELVNSKEFPIADYRNPDRMDQLGLT